MPVKTHVNLFPKTRIPQASHDSPEIIGEDLVGNDNGAALAQMVKWMRAVPNRLGHCAPCGLGHFLCHTGNHEGVFPNGAVTSMVFG